jgi:hypothetical protein
VNLLYVFSYSDMHIYVRLHQTRVWTGLKKKSDLINELSDISSSEMHTDERLYQTKYELSCYCLILY